MDETLYILFGISFISVAELLGGGGDAPGVLGRLQERTHRGDALPDGGVRRCYDVAVCVLEGGRVGAKGGGEVAGEGRGGGGEAEGAINKSW
jgi:hypothetical protein